MMNPDKKKQEWEAISAFYALLYFEKSNVERDYQTLFENYPCIFESIGIADYRALANNSPYKLAFDRALGDNGMTPEPDFIGVERYSKSVTVIEIKTPVLGDIVRSR